MNAIFGYVCFRRHAANWLFGVAEYNAAIIFVQVSSSLTFFGGPLRGLSRTLPVSLNFLKILATQLKESGCLSWCNRLNSCAVSKHFGSQPAVSFQFVLRWSKTSCDIVRTMNSRHCTGSVPKFNYVQRVNTIRHCCQGHPVVCCVQTWFSYLAAFQV